MSTQQERIPPGTIVGPYRIVRSFEGHGGMAGVFEVQVREKYRQPNTPPRLALKVASEEHQHALVAEADYLCRFDHPNVVRIFPLPRGEEYRPVYAARERFPFGWCWYYAMEVLDGGTLEKMTRSTSITSMLRSPSNGIRPLSVLQAVGIARQLAAALEHVHQQHVVNLDVKPANVLFRRRRFRYLQGSVPQAVLCDFGISRDLRHPRAGLLGVATPEYVSPEHLLELEQDHQARPVDHRSDIFSLGVTLYEMLTGRLPFETIYQIADPAYIPLPPGQLRRSIPPKLDEVVMRAMAKDPADRFQTAVEMQMALQGVRTPPDWGKVVRRTMVGAATAACLVAGGWGVNQLVNSTTPTPPTPTSPPAVRSATPIPAVTPTIPSSPSPTSTRRRATSTPRVTVTPISTLTSGG